MDVRLLDDSNRVEMRIQRNYGEIDSIRSDAYVCVKRDGKVKEKTVEEIIRNDRTTDLSFLGSLGTLGVVLSLHFLLSLRRSLSLLIHASILLMSFNKC